MGRKKKIDTPLPLEDDVHPQDDIGFMREFRRAVELYLGNGYAYSRHGLYGSFGEHEEQDPQRRELARRINESKARAKAIVKDTGVDAILSCLPAPIIRPAPKLQYHAFDCITNNLLYEAVERSVFLNIIDETIGFLKTDRNSSPRKENTAVELSPEAKRKIFVVYGRDEKAREAMFAFLRALHLQPQEWDMLRENTGSAAPYLMEVIDKGMESAAAVLVLLTPDELVQLRPELCQSDDPEGQISSQPRPNVLFEAGLAFARFSTRTVIVECGRMRPFSDISGRYTHRFDGSVQKRKSLIATLRTSGCEVDDSGTDWLSAGDFTWIGSLAEGNASVDKKIVKRVAGLSDPHRLYLQRYVEENKQSFAVSGRCCTAGELVQLGILEQSEEDRGVRYFMIVDDAWDWIQAHRDQYL